MSMRKTNFKKEVNPFKEGEEKMHTDFIEGTIEGVFKNVEGNGKFYHTKKHYATYPFVLKEDCVDENLYEEIRVSAKEYFRDNGIEWWGDAMKTGKDVPGHTLSSQVACLNHLFCIKNDEKAVLAIVNGIRNEYDKVSPIPYDNEADQGFIAFEVISDNEWLREDSKERKRGEFCTSIDALICAHHVPTRKNHIILIEWKYTETYKDEDKTCYTRMKRYNNLISSSKKYLEKPKEDKYEGSVYYQEPFYQLMRQTLWAEQIIKHRPSNPRAKKKEPIEAEDYLHIHVIPKGNTVLLNKGFKEKGDNLMEKTWRSMLKKDGDDRYILIDPEVLLKPIVEDKDLADKYSDLIKYLRTRYWRRYKKKK